MFEVSAMQYTDPLTYKIKDMNDEEIKGSFYEQELQNSTWDTLCIEKVLESKGNELLVKLVRFIQLVDR